MTEKALDKKAVIAELTRSEHGDLGAYLAVGVPAAREDPNFFAHLVAWNHVKGQVRDAKVALPMIALTEAVPYLRLGEGLALHTELVDNALAHLADLTPKVFRRAVLETTRFDKSTKKSVKVEPFAVTAHAPKRLLRRLVTRYLRDLEGDRRRFEYTAVLHGQTLQDLYSHYRVSCPEWVSQILFRSVKRDGKQVKLSRPPGSIFEKISQLHLMSPEEAAGTIARYKIPFLIAKGALGKKAAEPDTVQALIKSMSPTELVTNTQSLEKLGVKSNPALRAAFEQAIGKAAVAKTPRATLKTTRAAEAIDDDVLSGKLKALQEKQLDRLGGIDGDWLVLGDKSGSMSASIGVAAQVAGLLARMAKGKVHLVFFDTDPYYADVTGKTLEEITAVTSRVRAGGGTNMACGIQYALDKKIPFDGIVFVSDGANHGMGVVPVYRRYCQKLDVEPTLYFYQLSGEPDNFSRECKIEGVDLQTFDLRGGQVDYYSLPNLVQTMRVQRYSLIDEVMETPLRTLDEVLDRTKGMAVLPRSPKVTV